MELISRIFTTLNRQEGIQQSQSLSQEGFRRFAELTGFRWIGRLKGCGSFRSSFRPSQTFKDHNAQHVKVGAIWRPIIFVNCMEPRI